MCVSEFHFTCWFICISKYLIFSTHVVIYAAANFSLFTLCGMNNHFVETGYLVRVISKSYEFDVDTFNDSKLLFNQFSLSALFITAFQEVPANRITVSCVYEVDKEFDISFIQNRNGRGSRTFLDVVYSYKITSSSFYYCSSFHRVIVQFAY